jgi:hypothetical protein
VWAVRFVTNLHKAHKHPDSLQTLLQTSMQLTDQSNILLFSITYPNINWRAFRIFEVL